MVINWGEVIMKLLTSGRVPICPDIDPSGYLWPANNEDYSSMLSPYWWLIYFLRTLWYPKH